jgi:N-acetyl-anhydromuramyl-L-alanine amidase AmpD
LPELAVGFNFLADTDGAEQAAAFPCALYLDVGGSAAGLKCGLKVARLMTRGPHGVADTAARARRESARGASVVQIANEPNVGVEGWTAAASLNSNDEGLVVAHAGWFEEVCAAAPAVPILWTPPSPGVPGYEIWTDHPRSRQAMESAAGISWHAYGDFDLLRRTLDAALPAAEALDLDIYVTECNFGAGREVNLSAWASNDLPAFLDHARQIPRVKLVALFAHLWPHPDSSLKTSLDFGGTVVEDSMHRWLAAARPPRPNGRPSPPPDPAIHRSNEEERSMADIQPSVPTVIRLTESRDRDRTTTRGVVIHATRGGGADLAADYRGAVGFMLNPVNQVSAHFCVGPTEVTRLVHDHDAAWHSQENNRTHLGIEIAQPASQPEYSDFQYRATAEIVRLWAARYGFPVERVFTQEQAGLIGHEDTEQGKRHGKTDPGPRFDWDRLLGLVGEASEQSAVSVDELELKAWGPCWRAKEYLEGVVATAASRRAAAAIAAAVVQHKHVLGLP